MNLIYAFLCKIMPITTAFAAAASGSRTNAFIDGIVKWAAGIGGGLVAIFLIISLVKDGIGLAKGSGDSSVLKIIGKALFLILIIGLIYIAMNYSQLGTTAEGIASKGINKVGQEVNTALG